MYAAMLYAFRCEEARVHATAETAIGLCRAHGFAYYLAWATTPQGWALAAQRQAFFALRLPYSLALLAEVRAQTGLAAEGLSLLADARAEARALLAPLYGWFTEGRDTISCAALSTLGETLRHYWTLMTCHGYSNSSVSTGSGMLYSPYAVLDGHLEGGSIRRVPRLFRPGIMRRILNRAMLEDTLLILL